MGLRGAGAPRRGPPPDRRGERAAGDLSRLRNDAGDARGPRGADARRLVRRGCRRGGRLDRAAGGGAPRPGEGGAGEAAHREAARRSEFAAWRPERDPNPGAGARARDLRGRAGGAVRRPADAARRASRPRAQELHDRASRGARSLSRRDHVRRRRVRADVRRRRPDARAGTCAPRGDRGRQRPPLPRRDPQREPGALPRRGRRRAERVARLRHDAREPRPPRRAAGCRLVHRRHRRRSGDPARRRRRRGRREAARARRPPAGLPADVGFPAAGRSGAPTGRRGDPRGVRPPGAGRHRHRRPAPCHPRGARSAFGHRPAADRARRNARRDHLRLVADAGAVTAAATCR